MLECELCGFKKATRTAKVEGVILNVCDDCVAFGEEVPSVKVKSKAKIKIEGLENNVVKDFKDIVKRERIKRNLTQKNLAEKIGEKNSIIKRIENGWEPPVNVLKKLENFLSVKLLEEVTEEKIEKKSSGKELTIGDVVEVN